MAKPSFSRLVKIARGTSLDKDLMRDGSQASPLEHFCHFWAFTVRSFVQNRCLIRASALSYTTLLAMIPLLAIAISVTSSLLKKEGEHDIYKAIDKFIANVVPPATISADLATNETFRAVRHNSDDETNSSAGTNTVAVQADAANARVAVQSVVAENIHTFIHNTRSGALGVTGVLLLVFVAISMLNSIEGTFNDIWGIERGRDWLMRVGRFWIAITLGPLLIAVGIGLAGGSHFQSVSAVIEKTPLIGWLLIQTLTLLFIWFTFTLIYQFVPNTKVQFRSALAGGITAGTLWHLNNVFGFLYVSRVVGNSKMYGGLGLIPVFMAGLYLSWAIMLFGAQTAYAFQNRKIYLQEKMIEDVTPRDREILALRLMTSIGRRFQNGQQPAEVPDVATELRVPTKLAQQILQVLFDAHILTEIVGNAAYTPARPLESITIHDILFAMRSCCAQEVAHPNDNANAEVLEEYGRIEGAARAAATPVTLLNLIQRSQKPS
ncbi:MAG TPA: YhjD/YihY/BrkB family envelope integrity protein [Pseudomonadales bacterium]|nr:YhjD/YihY/BrkB family envelope integrity protein [Pseudomonadales bacterium]